LDYILIGFGGMLGALARYAVIRFVAERSGTTFPIGTIFVNITGAFLLGMFIGFITHGSGLGKGLGLALTTGFLGAYTTFSTFSYETVQLIQDGEMPRAIGYVFSSIIFGLMAGWLGILVSGSL